MKYPKTILNAANKLLADEQPQTAEKLLTDEFAHTKNPDIGLMLGKMYMGRYAYNEADTVYFEVGASTYRNYESMLAGAQINKWQCRFDVAEEDLQLLLEVFPEDRIGREELVETWLFLNRSEEAYNSLQEWGYLAKPTPNIKYLLALYQNRLGNYQQAIAWAKPLLKDTERHLKVGLLLIDSYYQLENFETCFEQIENVYLKHNEHLQVLYWQAILSFKKEKNSEKTISILESLQKEYDSFHLAHLGLGKAYLSIGNEWRADIEFSAFTIQSKWYDEGLGLHYLFAAEHEPDDFNLNKAISLSSQPNMPKLNYYLACIYGDVYKDYKQGIVYLLKSLERLPEHVASKRTLASFYAQVGEVEKGKQQYEEILKLSPGHKEAAEALRND